MSVYELSGAMVFMDIVTAFAVLYRRILFDDDSGDEVWFRKLAAAGFSQEDVAAIVHVISDDAWVEDVFCREDGRHFVWGLVGKVYCNMWFSQDSVDGVVRTSLGCVAGNPLLT